MRNEIIPKVVFHLENDTLCSGIRKVIKLSKLYNT